MDTNRTILIFIYCLLIITMRSNASEEASTTVAPGTMPNSTSPSPTTELYNGSSTTQEPPEGTASSSTSSSVGISTTAVSPAAGGGSTNAPSVGPASASSTTQRPPRGSASSSVGISTTAVALAAGGGSTNQSATTMDPKQTQTENMSHPAVKSESGKPNDNISNESGKIQGSAVEPSSTPKPDAPNNKKYLWIMLPVGVAVVAVAMYFRYKFFKVHHHPETTDNGTENASFQRTESNKDGVTLLGVKSSGTEEGAAA